MSHPLLQLPVIQNWSCHNCGGCCREHLIEVTQEEKERIEKQGWTPDDGVPADRPLVETISPGHFRLAHQDDGACVFLDRKGLCRIHARFGEPAKPLACRVYPYAFHPDGREVTVSLRFSCPSVVQNLGRRVVDQSAELQQIAREVVPSRHRSKNPPQIHSDQQLDWTDFGKFLAAFDEAFTDDTVDFATQLMRVLSWLELVEQSRFDTVRGRKLDDYLKVITDAARKAQPDSDLPILRPGRMGRIIFRQQVAQLLRHDTEITARSGVGGRLSLLTSGLRFTMGMGRVPLLPDPISVAKIFGSHNHAPESSDTGGRKSVKAVRARFKDAEGAFGGRSPEIDRLMVRYFRVKIQGLHFCGPANFGMNLLHGFRSLALMYPSALWVARIRALSHGRRLVTLQDAQAALATVDHNYGYSPALGMPSAQKRLQILGQMQQVTRLCGWYSR